MYVTIKLQSQRILPLKGRIILVVVLIVVVIVLVVDV